MNDQLVQFLRKTFPGAEHVSVEELCVIPGGFSRETFRFDARIVRGGREELIPLILRKDPPRAAGRRVPLTSTSVSQWPARRDPFRTHVAVMATLLRVA